MDKTVILPGMWGTIDSPEIDEPQTAYGVVSHRPGYRKVTFSGAAHPEGDLEEQARTILSHRRQAIEDLGGSMDDVTTMRWYVREDVLSPDVQVRLHEVRAAFFERPHYPASTMVGVGRLIQEEALVEVEIEAEIPDDGWTTEVIEERG